jgi:hypothetical protein
MERSLRLGKERWLRKHEAQGQANEADLQG